MHVNHFKAIQKLIENQLINNYTMTCEWFNGQYENLEENQGHHFPRVYIEFVQPIN
ncbi:MAG: hypothetical protein OXH57_05890 [Ekhidna sp.]|nr:hypothetical protein [Ekhidna sp.]